MNYLSQRRKGAKKFETPEFHSSKNRLVLKKYTEGLKKVALDATSLAPGINTYRLTAKGSVSIQGKLIVISQ